MILTNHKRKPQGAKKGRKPGALVLILRSMERNQARVVDYADEGVDYVATGKLSPTLTRVGKELGWKFALRRQSPTAFTIYRIE